jgi:N-acetyl-anhydromuramyl-L-alanine amidase AmpD
MIWIPSPNFDPGHQGYDMSKGFIIVHGTATPGYSAQDTARDFQDPTKKVSAHYVIGRDGTVIQCVDEANSAWANGGPTGTPGIAGDGVHHDAWWSQFNRDPNSITISIEHSKWTHHNSDQLTDEQKRASFVLIASICERHGIPKGPATAAGGITGHYSIDPVERYFCPGPYPWDELWAYLKGDEMLQITDTFARQYFTEVATTPVRRWRCKEPHHNHDVIGGILDFYRKIGGAPRLPTSGEIRPDPNLNVVIQEFEAGVIVYDPDHKWGHPAGFEVAFLHMLNSKEVKAIVCG